MLATDTSKVADALKSSLVPSESAIIADIARLSTVPQLASYWKYPCEEHFVTTQDGFVLGLHRIPGAKNDPTAYSAPRPYARKPILIWHGLSICANVFLCNIHPSANLALVLADAGFDVWLGNTRGNTYSRNHICIDSSNPEFWNFSIDELAKFDMPASVDYILAQTGHQSLAYIGYSQGSAQAFAALALDDELNNKINAFVALAPAMKPMNIANIAVKSLLRAFNPSILFWIFGYGAFAPMADTMRHTLPSSFYATIIQTSLSSLFDWKCDKFGSEERKYALYKHLFSETSVKSLVHWFQIITKEKFLPYDHKSGASYKKISRNSQSKNDQKEHRHSRSATTNLSGSHVSTNHNNHNHSSDWHTTPRNDRICPYPTKHISTPMYLFCGSADNISDRDFLEKHLPHQTQMFIVEGYEHMDFLWAVDAKEKVWDKVLDILGHRGNISYEI